MLEVLGYTNTFVSFFFFYSFTFNTVIVDLGTRISLRLVYLGLYIPTYLFTYVCIEKEIKWQRIIALALTITTIAYLSVYLVICIHLFRAMYFDN